MKQTTHLNHCKSYECVELYIHSPIGVHGVVLSQGQGQLYLLPTTTGERLLHLQTEDAPCRDDWGPR
jgi:hypothetical protein